MGAEQATALGPSKCSAVLFDMELFVFLFYNRKRDSLCDY